MYIMTMHNREEKSFNKSIVNHSLLVQACIGDNVRPHAMILVMIAQASLQWHWSSPLNDTKHKDQS